MYAFGMCLKSWSVMQNSVARSSGEAELYATVKGMSEGLGMRSLVSDIGLRLDVVVCTDSDACRGTCQRTGIGRLKHVEVETLWAQEVVRNQRVQLERENGSTNVADLMTKYLSRSRIDALLTLMGFVDTV